MQHCLPLVEPRCVVGGNHDLVADGRTFERNLKRVNMARVKRHLPPLNTPEGLIGRDAMKAIFTNARYLEDEAVIVQGIVVYGAPWQPPILGAHSAAAFDLGDAPDSTGERAKRWGFIPLDVDVLLTHTPPRAVLDKLFAGVRVGCCSLAAKLVSMAESGSAPKFHVFGHIHESRGVQRGAELCGVRGGQSYNRRVGTTFINAASVNLAYTIRPNQGAVVFDVPIRSKKE